MFGATQASMAFCNASVALVHGMSRPIGAHFHVPHGLSNAMLLPTVTRFSLEAALPRYGNGFAELTGSFGRNQKFGPHHQSPIQHDRVGAETKASD